MGGRRYEGDNIQSTFEEKEMDEEHVNPGVHNRVSRTNVFVYVEVLSNHIYY